MRGSRAACFPRAAHGHGPDAGSEETRAAASAAPTGQHEPGSAAPQPLPSALRPSHTGVVLVARRAAGLSTSAGAAPRSRWSCGSGLSRAVGRGTLPGLGSAFRGSARAFLEPQRFNLMSRIYSKMAFI